jgi:membrane protein
MSIILRNTTGVLKKAFTKWKSRDPFKESSVIAFNAIFSLPGLLVVVVTLSGYFFGHEIVTKHIHSTISSAMGSDTADQVQEMIIAAMKFKESIWATILGVITILLGATGVFVQMQKSLNIIWEVEAKPKKSGILTYLKTRLFSFGLVLSIAFLLLISLVISTILTAAGSWIMRNWSEGLKWLFNVLNFITSLGIITILFALMFKILPDAKIKWRFVWVGAFATALLFVLGKTLLGFYFGRVEPGSGYGAAGSIVLILLWTNYSSMIVFFGAEFTKAYSDIHYGNVPASEVAVKKPGRKV